MLLKISGLPTRQVFGLLLAARGMDFRYGSRVQAVRVRRVLAATVPALVLVALKPQNPRP